MILHTTHCDFMEFPNYIEFHHFHGIPLNELPVSSAVTVIWDEDLGF